MFHTISNIDNSINLQQYIDNRDETKRVGLKSFTYTIGWFNINHEVIKTKNPDDTHHIPDGHYNFQQLSDIFERLNITLTVGTHDGIASLETPTETRLSSGLSKMLGFKDRKWLTGTHTGQQSIDLAPYKQLYVHLEQVNTKENYFNGAPSTIIGVIPVVNKQFGDIAYTRFYPEYRCLSGGTMSELKIEVRDEHGSNIDNHGFPMSCVLEFI